MKKLKIVLFSFLCLLFLPYVVHAAYTVYWTSEDTSYTPSMRHYRTTINGTDYMTYCLDPGRSFGNQGRDSYWNGVTNGVKNYENIIPINPSAKLPGTNNQEYKYDLALMYAYQKMKENGWTNSPNDYDSNVSSINRAIGTTAFRLITIAFANGRGSLPAYTYYLNGGAGLRASTETGNNSLYLGKNLANEAISFAESNANVPFEQLAGGSDKPLKAAVWTLVGTPTTSTEGNIYKFTATYESSSNAISNIRHNDFQVIVGNSSATLVNKTVTMGSGNRFTISIEVNISRWNGEDLQLYIDTYYCDPNSASSNLYLLDGGYQQNMLIVTDSNCSDSNPSGGSRITVNRTSSCICDTNSGIYKYTNADGRVTECNPATQNCDSFITEHSCPNTCTARQVCQRPSTENGNRWICDDLEGNDGIGEDCTVRNPSNPEAQWEEECDRSCSIVDQQHYCDDGQPCSPEDYERDCECPRLEEECEDGDEDSCEEFRTRCTNCTPTVTVPSDCTDFDEPISESNIGLVDELSTKCASADGSSDVLSCIIDNRDISGNSYEALTETALNGNPYCKVWCAEKYEFTLPGARYTQSGGYFTLTTRVTGERQCFISGADNPQEGIDVGKFTNDYKEALRTLFMAYNNYSYWKGIHDAMDNGNITDGSTQSRDTSASDDPETLDVDESCAGSSASARDRVLSFSYREYNIETGAYVGTTQSELTNSPSFSGCDQECSTSCSVASEASDNFDPDNQLASARQSVDNALRNVKNIVSDYNKCSTGWDNEMNFDPDIHFEYREDYMSSIDGAFVPVNESDEERDISSSSDNWYCSGSVNNSYNCQGGQTSSAAMVNVNSILGGSYAMVSDNYEIGTQFAPEVSSATRVKKSKKYSAEYKSNNTFSTYSPYGTIRANANGSHYLWTNLPEGAFPISLIQQTGVFPFKFTYNNIGQFNNTGTLGRLMGAQNSIVVSYNNPNIVPDSRKCDGSTTANPTVDGGYICHYLNNCPTCDFVCDDDNNCHFVDDGCEYGSCRLTCENCIFDGNTANYHFRVVSLNNLFPNESRTKGYNWNSNVKAQATVSEIEALGEEAYITPQYSYTLTPSNMSHIREYNDRAGSFTNATLPEGMNVTVNGENYNDALYCDQVTINGLTYPVRCRSSFLDLIENSGNTYATDITRITSDNNHVGGLGINAYELFQDNTRYCPNGACITNGVGPSWRLRSGN